MIQLDENKRADFSTPVCRWCGQQITGSSVDGLHIQCNDELHEELDNQKVK
jgi:hypothetical protein